MLLRPPISTLFPYTTLFRSLKNFTNVEVLPSRILLLNGKDETIGQKFITHQWSKSLPFLHVPQVTILPFGRSEEHTSELQSRGHLVCRLLLEKKKKK